MKAKQIVFGVVAAMTLMVCAGTTLAAETWISRVAQMSIGYHQGDVLNTPDGGFVLSGTYVDTSAGYQNRVGLAKFDAQGELQWGKTYLPGWAGALDATPGGGFIMTEALAQGLTWVAKLDGEGNILAQVDLNIGGDIFVEVSGNVAYLVNENDGNMIGVVKMNLDSMTVEWEGLFSHQAGNSMLSTRGVDSDASGNLYVVGWLETATDMLDTFVLKMTPTGGVQAFKLLNSVENDKMRAVATVAADGGLVLAGDRSDTAQEDGYNLWVAKLDAGLNLSWQRAVSGPGTGTDWCNSVAVLSDGSFAVGGTTRGFSTHNEYDVWGLRIIDKSNPQIKWQKLYATVDRDENYAVTATPDGGMIFAAEHAALGSLSGTILFKADANGEIAAHDYSGVAIANPHMRDVSGVITVPAVSLVDDLNNTTFTSNGYTAVPSESGTAVTTYLAFEKLSR